MNKEVWIGFVEVNTKNTNLLNGLSGAYVNVLAQSRNKAEFIDEIEKSLREEGFDVIAISDAEPYSQRTKKYTVDNSIKELANKVEQTGCIQFGTFHAYKGK